MAKFELHTDSESGKKYKAPKGSWHNLSEQESSEIYQTHREALAGDLSDYREKLRGDIWDDIANPDNVDYQLERTATPNGTPISSLLLDAFTSESARGGLGGRDPHKVMYYCLDYLQNGKENQGHVHKINEVDPGEKIKIYLDGEPARWKLKVAGRSSSREI
ncbi:hypothetical protein HN680_00585, partial [Candidatus Peregrinibacteria bacterium]|nr:hypothetical protein [Candidatus Peregrinibacteria bacterium]